MLLRILAFCAIINQASGNGGRLIDPPGRSSAWRDGFQTPRNNIDDNLSCGGFLTQLSNGGKCGVCGDPWNGKRENEAGGKYATGTIVRKYSIGQTINLQVDITSNRYGWMEFRICPNNDATKAVTHDCLNAHVLQRADGNGTKTYITVKRYGVWNMTYKLPTDMKCTQCVLQWKYNTGDTWGVDEVTGKACIGCGLQEQFYGCADVSIQETGNNITPKSPRALTTKSPDSTAQVFVSHYNLF
ncbi:uncharacterized protein LOC132750735 [Ruditapes philippinarum]|uniref:uncharacterized protein LOC132750735 n=1 Tax=Ruditapes philippinarum TaxID=129788 RepID=UPI00295B18D6|nr:uncharacterized protein LOC132750735 [Ruditapes philippinarum]